MGQYKVPQDVEAEDKILGPLSLRQFIYVVIGLAWAGLMWLLLSKFIVIMIVAILPVTGFFILMGLGRRQEQSFENYFVAVVKFMLEPRIRMWQKDLTQDQLIKKEEKPPEIILTKNVSQGSLKQLALIMDTHGAQKDPTIQLQDESNQAINYGQRVIGPSQIAGPNQAEMNITQPVREGDDVLDTMGQRSEEVNHLLENVETNIHAQAIKNIQQAMASKPGIPNSGPVQSQPKSTNAIIEKAVSQGNNLTVEQLSRKTNANVLPHGQSVQLNPPTN